MIATGRQQTFLIPFLDGDGIPRMRQKQNRESGINTYLVCQFWNGCWINKEHNPPMPNSSTFLLGHQPTSNKCYPKRVPKSHGISGFSLQNWLPRFTVARCQGTKSFMRHEKGPLLEMLTSFFVQKLHCTQHPVRERAPHLLFGLLIILSRSSSPN